MLHRSIAVLYQRPQNSNFHDKETMWRFLNAVAALDYHLFTLSEQDEAFYLWTRTLSGGSLMEPSFLDPDDLFSKGISPAVYGEMETFVTTKRYHFGITALSTARSGPLSGFKLALLLQDTSSLIHITPLTIAFATKREESEQVFAHWLDLFQLVYNTWHPLYGRSFSTEADWPETTYADIETAHLQHLYEINFFGPDLVKKLGHNRVLSTPAWKAKPLDDGGVLIVPQFIFEMNDPKIWQAATQHLNMVDFSSGKMYIASKPEQLIADEKSHGDESDNNHAQPKEKVDKLARDRSSELLIFPTVQKAMYWKDIRVRLETLLGPSAGKLLGEQPQMQYVRPHAVVREDEALTPSNHYSFDLAIPNGLALSAWPNKETLLKGLSHFEQQSYLENYLKDFGRNLVPATIPRLAARWRIIGYYYGLTASTGRSPEASLLFVCLAAALADACEGYIISMGDYKLLEEKYGLGAGVYTAEEFSRAIPTS